MESELANSGRLEVSSKAIGELVMDKLRDLDRVAYIRFASVYRDFQDAQSFIVFANTLLAGQDAAVDATGQMSWLHGQNSRKLPKRRGRQPENNSKQHSAGVRK